RRALGAPGVAPPLRRAAGLPAGRPGGGAPPAALGPDGDVGDVDLVGHLPEAEIADDAALVAHDPAARHAILLDLVEEGPARPRHRERCALDAEDLVEVLR